MVRTSVTIAAILAAGLAGPAAAQNNAAADQTPVEGAEGTAAPAEGAEGAAETADAAPPAPPEYNGTASGSVSGIRVNVPVVCTGFGEDGPVRVQSDPATGGTEDDNGDGVVIDISATPTGAISLHILAGNLLFNLDDNSATVGPASLSYAITMTYTGGGEDRVDISASCE